MNAKSSKSASLKATPTEFVTLSNFQNFEDGSGGTAWLQVGSNEFSCSGWTLYFEELPKFVEQFRSCLKDLTGSAELKFRYETDTVRFDFARSGHVIVSGLLTYFGPLERSLRFAFETDQTFCGPFLRDLEEIAAELHG